MHVSSRYLELTKNKLQLTRLPREPKLPEERRWEQGTPKAVLEPLLDYWLESYNWRLQESFFNLSLPQFRTTIKIPTSAATTDEETPSSESLRIHFVHKPSINPNAIPLLLCYAWPSSFIEVHKIVNTLTDPQSLPSYGAGAQQAFHVVAPSIPGFGFSDSSSSESFGLKETAAVFDALMRKLGYEHYVAHGSGWGFQICRALALYHPQHCSAIHTANPSFSEPVLRRSPVAYCKYRVARLTRARISCLSFGYIPSDFPPKRSRGFKKSEAWPSAADNQESLEAALGYHYSVRPQTLAYTLCDSPVGLLACILDAIHTRSRNGSPTNSRSRSPFLSPSELELQDTVADGGIHSIPEEPETPEVPFSPRDSEINARDYTWSPTELLNWTMMQWLPGPEAPLRWLRQARLESAPTAKLSTTPSPVPVGISSFRSRNSPTPRNPLMWGSATHRISWVKRHQRPARFPAWEAPDLLVLDIRECFGGLLARNELSNLPRQEV